MREIDPHAQLRKAYKLRSGIVRILGLDFSVKSCGVVPTYDDVEANDMSHDARVNESVEERINELVETAERRKDVRRTGVMSIRLELEQFGKSYRSMSLVDVCSDTYKPKITIRKYSIVGNTITETDKAEEFDFDASQFNSWQDVIEHHADLIIPAVAANVLIWLRSENRCMTRGMLGTKTCDGRSTILWRDGYTKKLHEIPVEALLAHGRLSFRQFRKYIYKLRREHVPCQDTPVKFQIGQLTYHSRFGQSSTMEQEDL
jgi:hypothetical protein